MIEKLLLRLRSRDDLSAEEERALRSAVSELRRVAADTSIVQPHIDLSASILLLKGIVCRFKDRPDGTRQITHFHLPGDFVDLHSFTLKRLDHHVMTLTPCEVAVVPHDCLHGITENYPHLTRLLWFMTAVDAASHREWELSLGSQSAKQRVAHLFCELFLRLQRVGLTDGFECPLALSQTDIADARGLTAVHVNRTIKSLREERLITFHRGHATIHDFERLQELAEFDPTYLYLGREQPNRGRPQLKAL